MSWNWPGEGGVHAARPKKPRAGRASALTAGRATVSAVTTTAVHARRERGLRPIGCKVPAERGILTPTLAGGSGDGEEPGRLDAELDLGELADVVAVHLDGEGAVVDRLDACGRDLEQRLDLAMAHHAASPAGQEARDQRGQLERRR